MEEAFLPEEIIVFILTFLSVKTLLRFTCVSKRFRFIILSDPKFAKSQFWKAAASETHSHRLLFCTINNQQLCRLESLDLDTPSFGDEASVRNLTLPFDLPAAAAAAVDKNAFGVSLLGSSNGIVFLAFHYKLFYIWNPSLGLYKQLPKLVLPLHYNVLLYYGVGYLPATDDYRLFIYSVDVEEEGNRRDTMFVFSTRANAWKRHQVKTGTTTFFESAVGTTLNDALHWFDSRGGGIMAFDLGDEEGKFREMSPPNFENEDGGGGGVRYAISLGVSAGGCLSLARFPQGSIGCINVWVMNEYNVPVSWTKLFNLKFSNPPKCIMMPYNVLLIGTSMVAGLRTERGKMWLIRTDHKDEEKHGKYKFEGCCLNMIQIQETLIWIDD